MKPTSICTQSPQFSYEERKRIEELALQQASHICPPMKSIGGEGLSALTSRYTSSPVDTIAKATTTPPHAISSHDAYEPLIAKCEALAGLPKDCCKPIDCVLIDIVKMMEEQNTSSLTTRELLTTAFKEWDRAVEQELLLQTEKMRKKETFSNTLTRFGQALAPVTTIISGIASVAAGSISPLALGAAALSALFFIDALFDDATKKVVSSFLARQNEEEAKAWLERIRLFSSVVSLAANFETCQLKAVQIATLVSQTALQGIQLGLDRSKNVARAQLIEMDTSITISHHTIQKLTQTCKQLVESVLSIYQEMLAIQMAKNNTSRTLFRSLY